MPAKILYVDVTCTCSVLETRRQKYVLRNANAIIRNAIIVNMVMCDSICQSALVFECVFVLVLDRVRYAV